MGEFMGHVKKAITKLNLFIASVVLLFFYILILPFGKLIFFINLLLQKKDTKTYWLEPGEQKGDLSSPY